MPNMRHHFGALLRKINPPTARVTLASTRVGDVREWLRDQEFLLGTTFCRRVAVSGQLLRLDHTDRRSASAIERELRATHSDVVIAPERLAGESG